jgi:hypothetical protein
MTDFVDIALHESIAERVHSVGWANLTDAEREVGAVYLFHWHLLHGGLPTALEKLDARQLAASVGGLTRIGAPKAASLLARALDHPAPESLDQIERDLVHSEIAAVRSRCPNPTPRHTPTSSGGRGRWSSCGSP